MGEHITSSLESATQLKEKLMIFTLNVPRWLIFLLLIIGFLLLIVAFAVEIFTFGFVRIGWLYALGILMIVYSLIAALIPGGVLRKEQVVDNWSILIEKGKGRGEEVFGDARSSLEESKAPNIEIERKKMAPGLIRGILSVEREFLVVKEKGGRLGAYQIFIGARDYGESLDVAWYLTYRPSLFDAIICLFTLGIVRKNLEYSDTLYVITSDEAAKKKVIQVALRTLFRLRNKIPEREWKVKIASIDELKRDKFKKWFEIALTRMNKNKRGGNLV